MKKTILIITIILGMICLAACSSPDTNTLRFYDPEDESAEGVLTTLKTNSEAGFAEYKVDGSFKSVEVGIEHWQDGKLIDDGACGGMSLPDSHKGIIGGYIENDGTYVIGNGLGAVSGELEGYANEKFDTFSTIKAAIEKTVKIKAGEKICFWGVNKCEDVDEEGVSFTLEEPDKAEGDTWIMYAVFSDKKL